MKQLSYCPQCGEKTLTWQEPKKWFCPECRFTLYHNMAAAVAVIIRCEEEIFFTRRNQQPGLGMLDLAGGFVDPQETAEDACARELFEELKLQVDKSNLRYAGSHPNVYQYKDIPYQTLDLFFEYRVAERFAVDMEASEISETVWIPVQEIQTGQLAFDSQRLFLKKYLKL